MKKFIFLYGDKSGSAGERDDWMRWFASIGASIVDNGNPFGDGREVTKTASHDLAGDATPITGYTIVNAENMEAAEKLLDGVPIDRRELEWAWSQLVKRLGECQPLPHPQTSVNTPRDVCRWASLFLAPAKQRCLEAIASVVTASRFAPPGTVDGPTIANATEKAQGLEESLSNDALRAAQEQMMPADVS